MAHTAYLRVSTKAQAESGAGLAAQADACCRFAAAAGEELAATHSDQGISGAAGLGDRPGLLAAIDNLDPGDVLVVAKRDRLGRDPLVVAMIEAAIARRGARVASAAGEGTGDDDPTSVLMRRIVDAFAEYERLVIGARIKAALGAKRARGERVGQIPYGWCLGPDGSHLEPVAAEQEVISEARKLRGAGLSLRAVSGELARRGFSTRAGRAFSAEQVRRLVA